MRVQKDNREETVINQDAVYLMDILRSGSRGANDLTNYVFGIVQWTNALSAANSYINPTLTPSFSFTNVQPLPLNSGSNIVGLMCLPRINYPNGITNTVTVYMQAISGNAADKPPQVTSSIRQIGFGYRLTAEISSYSSGYVTGSGTTFNNVLSGTIQSNLFELRLTFRWPLLPDGGVGSGKLTFRTLASGTMTVNPATLNGPDLYFLQPSTFNQIQ